MLLQTLEMEKLLCNNSLQWTKIQATILHFVTEIKQKNNISKLHQQVKQFAQGIDQQFLIDCIQICVSKQLSSLIENSDSLPVTQLITSIREFYLKLFTSGTWKSEFRFERGIVCITKLVSEYFRQSFEDIQVNDKLDAEIYLILIYVIMGVKVGLKSFQVLEKKYLRDVIIPPKLAPNLRDSFSRKNSIRFFHSSYQLNQINFESLLERKKSVDRKKSVNRKKSMNNSSKQQQLQQFSQFLKQNLYVAPLPVVVKQKRSIQSYNTKQEQNPGQILRTIPNSSHQVKPRRLPFLTTQMSISLHSQIVQRNISIGSHRQAVKIKQRNPNISNHLLVFKYNNAKAPEGLDLLSKSKDKMNQEKWKMTSQEWKNTIHNIKGEFLKQDQKKVQKLERARRYQRDTDSDKKMEANEATNYNTIRKLKTSSDINVAKKKHDSISSCNFNATSNYDKTERTTDLDNKKRAGLIALMKEKSEPLKIGDYDEHTESPKAQISRNMLRENQKKFLMETKIRSTKMDYSMFALPSKSILKKQPARDWQHQSRS